MALSQESLTIIGVIHSARTELIDTPVQAALNRGETATVRLHDAFVDGLEGPDGFDYAWLITWLGRSDRPKMGGYQLRQVPFLLQSDPREIGIFATRGPRRVNPIGLSLIKLLAIEGGQVRFGGVDMLDGTPVIDIKPYVTAFDFPPETPRCGWFDHADLPLGATPASLQTGAAPGPGKYQD